MKARRAFANLAKIGQRRWALEKPPTDLKQPATEEENQTIDKEIEVHGEEGKEEKGTSDALFEDKSERRMVERKYPTPDELLEKYGIISQMDDRHRHLTEKEYAQLWWKVRDTYTSATEDVWDLNTTQQQKENWEATWQLFVRRLPPHLQVLYEECFNSKYLSFRPPKVSLLGMPPPADYLDVWQAEQPTFYIMETLSNPITFSVKSMVWGILEKYDLSYGWAPRGGYARIQCSHPLINAGDAHITYQAKRLPGQVCKLLPESKSYPQPRKTRRQSWFCFKTNVSSHPDLLSLPWVEIVKITGEGESKQAQVKIFKHNSRDSEGNASVDYSLETVDFDRIIGGSDRLDFISLGEPLRKPESRDIVRFLWPAPLTEGQQVKYHYSQEGYEYQWDFKAMRHTSSNEFSVNALMLPYDFISKREPDLPNTLGKISIVVGDREYPIMVDFWDALKRFTQARRNIPQSTAQLLAILGIVSLVWCFISGILKLGMYTKLIKPYNYRELQTHPRYRHIYGQEAVGRETSPAPWTYEKD